MYSLVLRGLIFSCVSTRIAASSSNCSNASDISVIQYASAIQDYSYLFYKSIQLNQAFFSSAPNSSHIDYYTNIKGMEQQNNISTYLLGKVGSDITGFQFPKCKFTAPNPANATEFLNDALYIETSLAGAFLGLSGYTQTPVISDLINWLAVQHGTHSTYIASFSNSVIFLPNGTSLMPPILSPDFVLSTGNEPFMLGTLLGGCVTAPKGPCS